MTDENRLDDLRDIVARFILDSATDRDCLYEALYHYSFDNELTEEEDQEATDMLYEIFGRAKVSVTIDEVEYNGN